MRAAANLDEIFNSGTTVDTSKEGNQRGPLVSTDSSDDFWNKATFNVPVAPLDPQCERNGESVFSAAESAELDAFDAVEKPIQKSLEEMRRDGIDRTPMLSVAEIRARFNKGSTPLFPKQIFKGSRTPTPRPGSSAADSPRPLNISSQEDSGAPAPTADTTSPAREPSESFLPDQKVQEQQEVSSAPKAAVPQFSEAPTMAEFLEMAKFHHCYDAIQRFSEPTKVEILIKPENPAAGGGKAGGAGHRKTGTQAGHSGILIKEMLLQFNLDQRLLVMLRQGAIRYIRLNDVIKADGSESCLHFLTSDEQRIVVSSERTHVKPIALYFTTTKHPMVILVEQDSDKDALLHLIIFLRQLIKTPNPFEIAA